MKTIAVTQRLLLNENYYEVREALDVNWGKFFKKINFLPIILPIEFDHKRYFNSVKIDGIILTGGNDLNNVNKNKLSLKRDIFEKKLIKYCIKKRIPVFGMCRGMEIIGDFFGANFKRVKNQVGIRHSLDINKKSKYFNELNKISTVNSFHNYAIDKMPSDLIVSARSNSGIIKAIEHKKYKIFGQMWHSEREKFLNKNQISLIKKFF
ncbi:gamma-glutamyl-gamma-aminobutyrate hydrolase family protein [Candidatus Pelagibacter sp. HIMB1495]|uniref:gamma-glutamyl-gamma-aminobutyrate hydrolase family protein n=1 Tax=unclassified Candidatus Pelagibacter TaxID=2647897 RepID=UPI003F84F7B7